jgi:hypothetical protein
MAKAKRCSVVGKEQDIISENLLCSSYHAR